MKGRWALKRWTGALTLAVALLVAVTGTAVAQDAGSSEGTPAETGADAAGMTGLAPIDNTAKDTVETEETPRTSPEMKEAMRQVPTYQAISEGDVALRETPQQTFLRLAEDYIYRTEWGATPASAIPIWPRGQLQVGPVQLFPYVVAELGWTDNAYRSSDKEASWFTELGAGVAGQYAFMGGRGAIDFGFDYRYKEFFNADVDGFSQYVIGAGMGYRWPQGFWFNIGVKVERLVQTYNIEFEGLAPRWQVRPFLDLGWDNIAGGKFNLQFGIDGWTTRFDDEEFVTGNRDEAAVWVKGSYPVSMTSRVYLRYTYRWITPDSSRINAMTGGNELTGGLEGTIPLTSSQRLVGFLEIGYQGNIWDDAAPLEIGTATVYTDDNDQKGTVVFRTGLTYFVGPRTSVDLTLWHDMLYSTRSNYQIVSRAELGGNYNAIRDLVSRLSTWFEYSDPSAGATYTRFGVGLGNRYAIHQNVDLTLDFDWSRRNSSSVGGRFTVFEGRAGVTVYFR